ncbi:hypothetical protein IV203_023862 [Nitzschia inconspicua]|uniref:Uncharacterized protein n=1 Tax=Nitzschia inconspicua TaxID=303405 RepID=A0A9K3PCS1_9STRA|nr:hypothetical protein IV203_023862 [Nitzschia inconspicua]
MTAEDGSGSNNKSKSQPQNRRGGRNNRRRTATTTNNSSNNNNKGNNTNRKNPKQSGNNSGKHRANVSAIPPSPQIKVSIRNICNAAQYGTVQSILEDLLPKIVEKCVERSASEKTQPFAFDIDQKAVKLLLDEETAVKEYKFKLEAERAAAKLGNTVEDTVDEAAEAAVDVVDPLSNVSAVDGSSDVKQEPTPPEGTELDKVEAPLKTPNSPLPIITVQPLYVLPARKTKRRGERPGVAYVLLIAPKVTDESINKGLEPADKKGQVIPPDNSKEEGNVVVAAATTTKVVDYTQQLAKCKLLLSSAVELVKDIVNADCKTQQYFSGCTVEQSLNQKTWKLFGGGGSSGRGRRPDRREGTVESSQDFKQWLESQEKLKEDLKARPKPVPGGGVSTTNADGTENGEPVAALVQHLLAKKQEQKQKKTVKKKKDETSNKRKPKKSETSTSSSAAGGVNDAKKTSKSRNPGRKKKDTDAGAAAAAAAKKRKKKNKPPRSQKGGAAVAPLAVLKPPPASSS